MQLICADGAPCSSITLSNVNMWSQTDKAVVKCESAYGSGLSCIRANSGSHTSYAIVTSSLSKPPGYSTPTTMAGDLSAGYATDAAIPTPTIPTAYFPGLPQISPLAKNKNSGSSGTSTTSAPASGATAPVYGQCGGQGWTGATVCASGSTCVVSNTCRYLSNG